MSFCKGRDVFTRAEIAVCLWPDNNNYNVQDGDQKADNAAEGE